MGYSAKNSISMLLLVVSATLGITQGATLGTLDYQNPKWRNDLRWPGGIVPYVISPYFNQEQQKIIREGMDQFHNNTCILFIPYVGQQQDYIRITSGNTGCHSSVGRVGGVQNVNLQVPSCMSTGTVAHELMHALGFPHEQSHPNRDKYVAIVEANIKAGHKHNFDPVDNFPELGVGYLTNSILHYHDHDFSGNGGPTIVSHLGYGVGSSGYLNPGDIVRIERMYNCLHGSANTNLKPWAYRS